MLIDEVFVPLFYLDVLFINTVIINKYIYNDAASFIEMQQILIFF